MTPSGSASNEQAPEEISPAQIQAYIPSVSVRVYRPEARLGGYVTFYYFVDARVPFTDFLYPEWGNVRLALSGTWRMHMKDYPTEPLTNVLFGPTDRCAEVSAGPGRMVGFGMTPLGWHRLIGDAGPMANRLTELGDALDVDAGVLRDAFNADTSEAEGVARWNGLLGDVLDARPPDDPQAIAIDRAMRCKPADVAAFAREAGMPVRTLHRLCLRTFGFPPKRLLRRQRFLDTLGLVRSAVRNPIAPSLGTQYYDVPQFYRDFRDFMGMSARTYFASERQLMGPAAEAQLAAEVTLSFALPPPPEVRPAARRRRR